MKFTIKQKLLIFFLIIADAGFIYLITFVKLPPAEVKKFVALNAEKKDKDASDTESNQSQMLELKYDKIKELTDEEREELLNSFRVNINTANYDELSNVKGIGASLAEKIIQYREQNGMFASFEDLRKVKGFGEKKIEKVKDKITFGKVDQSILKKKLALTADGKINLNLATAEDLDKIDGVGPGMARKILEYRDKIKKFHKVEELRNIPGIGPKKYEHLSKYVTVVSSVLTKEQYIKRQEKEEVKETRRADIVGKKKEKKSILMQDKNKKVNINNADIDELTSISKIGKSAAERIIEYRKKNGRFRTIEDIMNVSGIGEATFEKIKDKISVR